MVHQRLLPRRLVVGVALLAAIIVVGIVGFMVAGLSAADALLTTVSAVTTVGYASPRALSAGAKVFNTALILGGVGTGVYVLGSLTEFLVEGGIHGNWQHRKGLRRMQELEHHYIISGFGRVGQRVAMQLADSSAPFVIVDTNPDTIGAAGRRAGARADGAPDAPSGTDGAEYALTAAGGTTRAGEWPPAWDAAGSGTCSRAGGEAGCS